MGQRVLEEIRQRADAGQSDVAMQIEAAYACDRAGFEAEAAVYYDRAWHLGVPHDERHDFVIGYGSTLRNVGRLDESLEVLQLAAREYEGDLAPLAFMALTLNSAGRSDEAVALLLDCLVAGGGPGVERFARALSSYADLLRE
jgi:tetratricopeptide (TPR) repeat protein